MIVLLEDSWKADDIKKYYEEVCELSQENLYNLDSKLFINSIYFCCTDIVQYHLNKLGIEGIVPDTYDNTFKDLFKRNIEIIEFCKLGEYMKSKNVDNIFIKPYLNNKTFDGQIYYDNDRFVGQLPNDNDKIYVSEKVIFLSEYRLLIGNNKLYGFGFMQGLYPDIKVSSINKFIDEIISKTDCRYLCIDIGYIKEIKKWAIVELNPPFSLDDYNIPLNDYINFCTDACEYIKNRKI